MAIYNCSKFLSQLESWSEGERTPDARGHLRDCAACQNLVEDLSTIQTEARSWGDHEPEPPEYIWSALRTQLEQEGLIHSNESQHIVPAALSPDGNWLRGFFDRIPRPVLAGAYLSILVALGFAVSGPLNKQTNEARWLEGTQVATSPLSAELNSFEQNSILSNRDANPAVTASLQQNLAIVDNYISLCEKSVQEEPQNEVARDYLYEAYHQKADLLAQISERGENVQ